MTFDQRSVVVLVGCLLGALALLYLWNRGRSPNTPLSDGGYPSQTGTETEATKPAGVHRWLTTVDHKDIGLLYIVFSAGAALWGGTDAMMIRTELITPGKTVWGAETYDALFTEHAFTMLFFFVTPAFTGLANYFVPLLIGADDMAFPRVNAIAFWLLPPSFLLVRAGLISEVVGKILAAFGLGSIAEAFLALEPSATGWTLYTPLSVEMANPQLDLLLLGLHLGGIATTLAAINFTVTIFTERADDVTWADLDIFSWAMLTTSGLVLFAFPLLGSALVMLLLDRNFGTTFYALEGGGPILWQHLFWFFGHPEVYIVVLPAFGINSLMLPKFAGRKLFGFKFIVYSTLAIGVLSFGVWAHHMFSTGIDPRVRASFMAVSLAIAVPSAVKTFNWITTMWGGKVRLTAPMLCLLGGIGLFVIGGITGVFLAAIPIDLVLHDTYYVVGHFHLILMGVITLSIFAASYYWFPILTGRMYNERLARVQVGLAIIGVAVTFLPLLVLGYLGLPRRYAVYPEQFTALQQLASVGAYVIGASVVLWVINVVESARLGPIVTKADVWDLRSTGQFTREWRWFEARLAERGGGSPERRDGDGDE